MIVSNNVFYEDLLAAINACSDSSSVWKFYTRNGKLLYGGDFKHKSCKLKIFRTCFWNACLGSGIRERIYTTVPQGLFTRISKICDRVFLRKEIIAAVNYFRRKLHHIWLIGSCINLGPWSSCYIFKRIDLFLFPFLQNL